MTNTNNKEAFAMLENILSHLVESYLDKALEVVDLLVREEYWEEYRALAWLNDLSLPWYADEEHVLSKLRELGQTRLADNHENRFSWENIQQEFLVPEIFDETSRYEKFAVGSYGY